MLVNTCWLQADCGAAVCPGASVRSHWPCAGVPYGCVWCRGAVWVRLMLGCRMGASGAGCVCYRGAVRPCWRLRRGRAASCPGGMSAGPVSPAVTALSAAGRLSGVLSCRCPVSCPGPAADSVWTPGRCQRPPAPVPATGQTSRYSRPDRLLPARTYCSAGDERGDFVTRWLGAPYWPVVLF